MHPSDMFRLRYGQAKGSIMDVNFTYCSNCNTVLKEGPYTILVPHGACMVCEFDQKAEAEAEAEASAENVTDDEEVVEAIAAFHTRAVKYKRAEKEFTAFLKEVRQFFSEEEFLDMCRGFYHDQDT